MITIENQPLLSIVVPVYGTEKYLNRCLDSVLNCTYRNIEVIVVNDDSPGNVKEIVDAYQDKDKRIKIVSHDVNRGLFRARITGVENSCGKYIAFLDSDDHVSCDFYRKLILKALENDCDMVMGEYYLEFAEGQYQYPNLAHTRVSDIELRGRKISELLFEQEGKDFSLHVVWNKIYRRDLWEKCRSYFLEFDKKYGHTIMCEDVLYSSFFYYFAETFCNTHIDYYYYFKGNENASTSNKVTFSKVKKSVIDVSNVFNYLKSKFQNEFKEDIFCDYIEKWYTGIKKYRKVEIENNLSVNEKAELYEVLNIDINDEFLEKNKRDDYFYQQYTEISCIQTEEIKRLIFDKNIEVVSFDIFDTLVVRPFYEPTDLFILLDIYANKLFNITDEVDFKQLRIDAEWLSRQNNKSEDVTLDEIYGALYKLTNFDRDKLERVKQKEIELEIKYCKQRNFAKELFDLAKYLGKKVIITSDMYLPEDVIKDILRNNGYDGYDRLYLSNVVGLTKSTSSLFKHVVKDLNVDANQILHIGDNYHSDVQQAKRKGLQSHHLPKPVSLLMNEVDGYYCGEAFKNVYKKQFLLRRSDGMLTGFFGLRTMLGVIANKIFDNPFQNINTSTDFNIDPRFIGYGTLGMHIFAVAKWLAVDVKKFSYKNLNFFARDGYIPMEAFKILNGLEKLDVNINYLPLTRTSIIPLQIKSRNDLLNFYGKNMFIFNKSPKYFVELLKDYTNDDFFSTVSTVADKAGIKYTENFTSVEAFSAFCNWFWENIDEHKLEIYRENFNGYYEKCFDGKTANFDIGYSCRIDYALKQNFNYDVSSYFIHINNDIAHYRADQGDIDMHTFYQYSPGITGTLREYLLSAIEPSVEKIKFKEDDIEIVCKKHEKDYLLEFSVGGIQKHALMFVKDMVEIFGEDLRYLYYQRDDVSMMNEYFNAQAKNNDRMIFSALNFEDDIGPVGKTDFLNLWGGSMNAASYNYIRPLWKQAIVLFFVDRALLKSRAKRYLAAKPMQLKAAGIAYKTARWIYHKFFARWIKL